MEDFYDTLEPEPPRERDMLAEAIGEILDRCVGVTGTSKTATPELVVSGLESSFRRFVAMIYVIKPQLLGASRPAWFYAEALGFTRQGFSRLCTEWSDVLGGMRNPAMRTQAARDTYRNMKRGGSAVGTKKTRTASHIGGNRVDTEMRQLTEHMIVVAMEAFRTGKAWSTPQRRKLLQAGLIDAEDQLTDSGRERLAQAQESAPNQGVVTC